MRYKGKATTISVVATREWVNRVRMVALANDVRIGDLVRDAVEKYCGDKIAAVVLETGDNAHTQPTA